MGYLGFPLRQGFSKCGPQIPGDPRDSPRDFCQIKKKFLLLLINWMACEHLPVIGSPWIATVLKLQWLRHPYSEIIYNTCDDWLKEKSPVLEPPPWWVPLPVLIMCGGKWRLIFVFDCTVLYDWLVSEHSPSNGSRSCLLIWYLRIDRGDMDLLMPFSVSSVHVCPVWYSDINIHMSVVFF